MADFQWKSRDTSGRRVPTPDEAGALNKDPAALKAYLAGKHPTWRHPSEPQPPPPDFAPKLIALPPREHWGTVDPNQLYAVAATRLPKPGEWSSDTAALREAVEAMRFAEQNGARVKAAPRPGEQTWNLTPESLGIAPPAPREMPSDAAISTAIRQQQFGVPQPPAPTGASEEETAGRIKANEQALQAQQLRKVYGNTPASPFTGMPLPPSKTVTDREENSPTYGEKVAVPKETK